MTVTLDEAKRAVSVAMSWDCGCSLDSDAGWWADVVKHPDDGCLLGIENGFALELPTNERTPRELVDAVRVLTPLTVTLLARAEWERREQCEHQHVKCVDCGGVALAVVYGQPTCGDYCPAGDCDGDCGESRDGCACE